jgi:hypothetical protein
MVGLRLSEDVSSWRFAVAVTLMAAPGNVKLVASAEELRTMLSTADGSVIETKRVDACAKVLQSKPAIRIALLKFVIRNQLLVITCARRQKSDNEKIGRYRKMI